MKKINFILIIISVVLMSCNLNQKNKINVEESPLIAVIKLISAESLGNVEEAKKYIDIKRVYSQHVNDSINYIELFEKQVKFKGTVDKSGKFTNQFKFYNYNITETIDGSEAKVKFMSIRNNSRNKEIIYSLNRQNSKWIVIDIKYVNSN